MKERPILFSGQMVNALLEGRKTQTRRVVKFHKLFSHADWPTIFRTNDGLWGWTDADKPIAAMLARPGKPCPYGQVGDRLWVRETWLPDPPRDFGGSVMFDGTFPHPLNLIPERYRHPGYCIFKAAWQGDPLRYHPSIFMPRWASRITLEITGVRVERLQEITEEAAIAEGIEKTDWPYSCEPYRNYLIPDRRPGCNKSTAVASYYSLWESINGKTHPWSENPWVWVIEFKREGGQT